MAGATAAPRPAAPATAPRWAARAAVPLALGAVVGLAAALRLLALNRVPPDPFYDAAVRSMAGSWHALLVGALEPGARASIDKPPLDLWLQVASVKALGFSRISLQLPAALAGIAGVALLYDVVRRVAGPVAGLAAASVLAVLPVSVLTARSDTMDTVMATQLVLAAWLVVHSQRTGRPWLLYAGGAAAGLAFETKLLEALVAGPALAVLAGWGWSGRRRHLLGAVATFLVVALAWLVFVSLLPAGERPFAIGSANGSAWNAAFLYNGFGRLSGHGLGPRAPGTTLPGPTRLLGLRPINTGILIGAAAAPAALFGLLAAFASRAALARGGRRVQAAALGLATWLLTGLVLYSAMSRLHVRYLEGFTPAVAGALGVGVVVLARAASRRTGVAVAYAAATIAAAAYALWLVGSNGTLVAIVAGAGMAAVALVAAARRRPALWPAAVAASLAAVLVGPLQRSVKIVQWGADAADQVGMIAPATMDRLSAFLVSRQGSAYNEVAVESPYTAAGIVRHDVRPVLVLDNIDALPLVSPRELRAAIRRGEVRYVLLSEACRARRLAATAGCADYRWVRANGRDVSAAAGLTRGSLRARLYRVG